MGGQNNDLQARPAILQLLEEPDAVHVIHAQVGDDQVGSKPARRRQCQHTAFNRLDVITLRAQADSQQAQQSGVVVDHENSRFAFADLVQGRRPSWLGMQHARGNVHCDRPSLLGLRSFSERSMLAIASSFARASSSSLRKRPFSSVSSWRR